MLYSILLYSIIVVLLTIFFKKKRLFSNFTGDFHQLFSNKKNIPLVGGVFLLLPTILINYQNIFYSISLILIFLLGFFSDQKILISAKKRFLLQITLIIFSVILLELKIVSSRVFFFDNLLQNIGFNILFTSFCLLILVNGSNFIDGLNGLLLFYMTLVIFVLFKLNLIDGTYVNKELMIYLSFFIAIIILLNLCNLLMLGDAGAYLLSFFVGYLIIKCHYSNSNLSPYFFITLLWYPCFENLFSIIRKLKEKFSPLKPDNNHLHQLLYLYLKNKLIKNSLIANNLSSLLIFTFNIVVISIGAFDPQNTLHQIEIIVFSITSYIVIFLLLKNILKNYK